jgi:dTDP-4-dehydrorhamnose reductase
MRLLLIGGSGLLGTEVHKQLKALESVISVDSPPHKELDVCNIKTIIPYVQKKYDKIICLVGEKNQTVIELDSYHALRTNIQGIGNVVEALQINDSTSQLVYISTGYVYKGDTRYHKEDDGVYPCSKYAWSKLGGECAVRMLDERQHLIIRCEFSKQPWHRDWAYTDQYTSREEITVTTNKILSLIMLDAYGTYNIGGKRQSIWKYAQSISNKPILKDTRRSSKLIAFPRDTSLCTKKYDKLRRGQ